MASVSIIKVHRNKSGETGVSHDFKIQPTLLAIVFLHASYVLHVVKLKCVL